MSWTCRIGQPRNRADRPYFVFFFAAFFAGFFAAFNRNKRSFAVDLIVYLALKGYLAGPYEYRPALDEVVQFQTGLAFMTGPIARHDQDEPVHTQLLKICPTVGLGGKGGSGVTAFISFSCRQSSSPPPCGDRALHRGGAAGESE